MREVDHIYKNHQYVSKHIRFFIFILIRFYILEKLTKPKQNITVLNINILIAIIKKTKAARIRVVR